MIDILNKHFQDSLHMDEGTWGLVQSANYLAYFLMAIPAGLIARKVGYKGGILVGLALIASGAFLFIHAVSIGTYSAFLLGLFVIAAGMTCLWKPSPTPTPPCSARRNTARRASTSHRRSTAWAGFSARLWADTSFSEEEAGYRAALPPQPPTNAVVATKPMPIPACPLPIWASASSRRCGFWFLFLHRCRTCMPRTKAKNPPIKKPVSSLPAASWRASASRWSIVWGLLYFFIARIMGLVWALLNLPANVLDPVKYGLIIVAYLGSFIVVSKNWDMFRRKHFTLGVLAQFLYVAAQTGIFSFCVNYIIENDADVTPAKAATMLGGIGFVLFTVGRFCGSAVISQFKPHLVLAAYAAINVVLAAVCMGGGKVGLIALFGTFFFMSVMFPTIFALGIRGLGDHTKLGSSLIVMSIVGGAIAPPRMGRVCRRSLNAPGHAGPTGLFRVHCRLRLDLAKAGGQGRREVGPRRVRVNAGKRRHPAGV